MEQHIQRYTRYIQEDFYNIDIDTATYKEHLHKSFELFACIQLSKQYNSIFLHWGDVHPEIREEKCMARDMGIDAWDMEGNRVSQMKLYQGKIAWSHFSTFLGCCYKFKDVEKILYRTFESTLCKLIRSYVKDKTIIDKTISGADFRSECKKIQALPLPTTREIQEPIIIRDYQKISISYLEKGKNENKNIYLSIPTGCGKTFIVLQYHIHHRNELLLVLVPRVVLMEQWGEECENLGIKPYLIGTGQHYNLEQYKDETIVICVYDSFPNIYEQKDKFNRYCIDEAHHSKIPERYMDTEVEHYIENNDDDDDDDEDTCDNGDEDADDNGDKQQPMSYMKCIQSLSETNKNIYISATLDKPEDDDNSIFYEYKVRQAIEEGYLCDYQFVFPIFEEKHITNEHLAHYLVHKQHESHCVIYAPSCKEGQEFAQMLNQLRKGCAGYIDADTSYKERQRLFAEFEAGRIQFLVNIRILVEGFNAPHIRSVFFLRVSTSEIFIIQAIGRALRQHLDKKIATIYVPFTHESDLERIQTFIGQLSTYDERIKNTVDNENIGGYINIECGEEKEQKDEYDSEDDENNDNDNDCDISDDIFECRYNLIVDSMGNSGQYERIWINTLKRSKEFIDKNKRRPKDGYKRINVYNKIVKTKDDTISVEEYTLARWLCKQKQNYKKELYTMKNEKIKKLWEEFINDDNYKKYMMLDLNDYWIYRLEQVKKYMDKEHKRPYEKSTYDTEKQLGQWIGQQQLNYTKNVNRMKDNNIRMLWNEFMEDDKYKMYFIKPDVIWMSNLENVKKYIHEKNDKPTYYKCKNEEDKELGKWLDRQINNYNTKKEIVYNNEIIKKIWEEFINNENYKKYFMTPEEKWIEKLNNCEQFIKTHKKQPDLKSKIKEEQTLARWIKTQVKNYREKCEILGKSETLQKMWETFIADN
jgi:superfamily II DNA or RNA helicase